MKGRYVLLGIGLFLTITLTSYAADQKTVPTIHVKGSFRSCQLQIQDPPSQMMEGQLNFHPATLVNWSWHEAVKYIQFRWRDSNPKTTAVVWQVGLIPFTNGKNWQYPPGMVAHKTVKKTGDWSRLTIDFGQFAPVPNPVPYVPPIYLSKSGQKQGDPEKLVSSLAKMLHHKKISSTISLYVRIVPIDAANNRTGFASRTMEIVWGQQPSATVTMLQPPPAVHPNVRIVRHDPIKWPDNQYIMMCTREVSVKRPDGSKWVLFEKGKEYDFTPRLKSGFEEFLNAWGGLFSFIGQVYDWVSKIYNNALHKIADLTGPFSPATFIALQAGAMALGMPPTLPSFDELSNMGKDYLAETLIEQVSGMSPEQAKQTVQKLTDAAKAAYQNGDSGDGSDAPLFVPAPSQKYRPGILWLQVSNPGKTATTAMDIVVNFSKYKPDWKVVLGDNYTPQSAAEWEKGSQPRSYYRDANVHIPSLTPGKVLQVPVALKETYPAPTATPQEIADGNVVDYMWFMYGRNTFIEHTVWVSTVLFDLRPSAMHNRKAQGSLKFKARG
jgi:hypothetical protein